MMTTVVRLSSGSSALSGRVAPINRQRADRSGRRHTKSIAVCQEGTACSGSTIPSLQASSTSGVSLTKRQLLEAVVASLVLEPLVVKSAGAGIKKVVPRLELCAGACVGASGLTGQRVVTQLKRLDGVEASELHACNLLAWLNDLWGTRRYITVYDSKIESDWRSHRSALG
eukprot:scaffold78389_cov49-Prasinocladus_malaysianus.AAC.1